MPAIGRIKILRIFLAVFLLLAAYFVIPVLMIWVPAFAIGCAWPEKVSRSSNTTHHQIASLLGGLG